MKIYTQMVAIMSEVDSIEKDRCNTAQSYNFRSIDDVYNSLHSVMSKHGVFTTSTILSERSEERQSAKGGTLIYRVLTIEYTFWADDGSFVKSSVIGEGMDSGDKASNKALSVAHKYALLQAFMVPTQDLKDPENDSPEVNDIKVVYINDQQATNIVDACAKKAEPLRVKAICEYYKVDNLTKIPLSEYPKIMGRIAK